MDLIDKIRRARELGIPEDLIQRRVLLEKSKEQPVSISTKSYDYPKISNRTYQSTSEEPKERGFRLSDLLPIAGGVLGAVGGSFVAPGLGTAVGGGTGAAAGEALRQSLEGEKQDVGRVVTEGALGAIPVTKIAGAALKGTARAVGVKGADIALKGLRPSKTQIAGFAKDTGKDLTDFVMKNKLFEKGVDQVDTLIRPLQQQYDDIAINAGRTIPASKIYSAFTKEINTLKKIPSADVDNMVKQLQKELLKAKSIFKVNKEVPLADIVTTRRQIDSLLPKNAFSQDAIASGKNRIVRNIYKNIIDETTGETKEIGSKLRDLYAFREIADIQQYLGKGNLPVGLQTLINLSVGPSLAGGAGYAAGERDPIKLLGLALTGWGAAHVLNSPKAMGVLSKAMTQIGKKGMVGPSPKVSLFPEALSRTADQTLTRMGAAPFRQSGQVPESPSLPPMTAGEDLTPTLPEVPETPELEQPQSPFPKEKLAALMLQYPKQASTWKYLYEIYNPKSEPKEKGKAIPAGQVAELSDIKSSIDLMDSLNQTVNKSKEIMGPLGGRVRSANPWDVEAQSFQADMMLVAQTVGRALEGGVLRQEDVKKYLKILPQITDTPEVARKKIASVKTRLETKLKQRQVDFEKAGYSNEGTIPSLEDYYGVPNQVPESPTELGF